MLVPLQVGTTHCIAGVLYGYKDTMGAGGEYWNYTGNGKRTTNTTWKYGDRMIKQIEFAEHGAPTRASSFVLTTKSSEKTNSEFKQEEVNQTQLQW